AVEGAGQPQQSAAFGQDAESPADGRSEVGQQGPVGRQFGGEDFGEAAAGVEAVDGVGEALVVAGVEGDDLGAEGGQGLQVLRIDEAEGGTGGDGDAGARAGAPV